MDIALITAAIAVLGTLLGSIITGRFQERATRAAVTASRGEALRSAQAAAALDLAAAVSDHRRALWQRGKERLDHLEAGSARDTELAEEGRRTRAASTRPLTALRLLIQDDEVRAAANRMVSETHAIRGTIGTTPAALNAAREEATRAHDDYVDTVARYLRTV
ncbi:hypothetical protein ACWF94_21120 [Streptomyces sp. NPDC055078]